MDADITADELIEVCSADEEVFSRDRATDFEAEALASTNSAREVGDARDAFAVTDELFEGVPSYWRCEGLIVASFERVKASMPQR